jgi:hypothetical protein
MQELERRVRFAAIPRLLPMAFLPVANLEAMQYS